MSVRAKFTVESITNHRGYGNGPMTSVKMIPVGPKYVENKIVESENTKFWSASPSGEMKLDMVNAAAAEQFVVGKEYFLDFTPAE